MGPIHWDQYSRGSDEGRISPAFFQDSFSYFRKEEGGGEGERGGFLNASQNPKNQSITSDQIKILVLGKGFSTTPPNLGGISGMFFGLLLGCCWVVVGFCLGFAGAALAILPRCYGFSGILLGIPPHSSKDSFQAGSSAPQPMSSTPLRWPNSTPTLDGGGKKSMLIRC